MVQNITQYPTQTGFDFGGTVRHFDDTLQTLITDLQDTITANNLEGLAAFQIGSPLNLMVIRYEGDFLAIINPVIFTKDGELTPRESTAYYPNLSAVTKRAKNIKLMYDDIHGKQQFLTATDNLAVLIQRKNDYLLGSTFLIRLSPEEKKIFENKLRGLNAVDAQKACNISPFSDKILTALKYGFIVAFVALLAVFSSTLLPYLKIFEATIMIIIGLLIGTYFIRALYEGKRCGVCQFGNTAAIVLTQSIYLGGLYLLNYWLVF